DSCVDRSARQSWWWRVRFGGAGAASPEGTTGAGGTGGTGGTARGSGPNSPGGTAGAGGAGGAAGAGGAGAGGTGGAGAAGPGGVCIGGAGAAGANGAVRARGATGAAGSGGTGGNAGAGGVGAAGAGGTASAGGAGGATGPAGTGGAGGTAGARGAGAGGTGGTGGAGAAGPGGARTRGDGAAGADGAVGAGGAGGATRATSTRGAGGTADAGGARAADQSQPQLLLGSPMPAPAPHIEVTGSLNERREPETRASTPVCARRVARPCPPAVPCTHGMALRPSCVPQHVVLPEPPASSLPHVLDPESDLARAASPTVTRLLATVVTDPDLESTAVFALVSELVDFAARSRLDYVASLVTESESVCSPSVGSEFALGSDVLEDRQFELECLAAALPRFASILLCPEGDPDALDIPTTRSYAEAIAGEYSTQWQTAMDAEMAFWRSTGTYVDDVPPPRANIVDGMWIFRVKQPPGSLPAFKAPYVARGFSQRQGVDFFQTFSPTPKMTTLRMLLHVAAQRDYELTTLAALGFASSSADSSLFLRTDTTLPPFYVLVYVDDLVFATADTEALALVKAELQERHTCTDLGELCSYLGLHITRDRARRTITLTQSHIVHQVLQHFGFQFSSPQPTPLSIGHSLSAPPSDESVEPSGPYPELVGCLMYLMMCTRPDLVHPPSLLARYVAPGRHRKVHWDAVKRVLRYLCSTSGMGLVLGGQGSVVLTKHSDASLADDQATQRSSEGYTFSLGSGSVSWRSTRSSSVLGSSCEAEIYARAMAAQELRWLTYRNRRPTWGSGLQRRQLRLSYVASRANTADVFIKALESGDHQRFCTALGLVPTLPHPLVA
ncbi:unnamed protein product, partial [Closterium sp. NIES-54]